MLNTLKKLGELARVIKDETRVSLDISECAAVAEFCASERDWDLDECIKYLDSENNYYGSSVKLLIYDDINYDAMKAVNDIITWGVREFVAYRMYTNKRGYTHIKDMWEQIDEMTRVKHLISLGLDMYKECRNCECVLNKMQESYFNRIDGGIHLYIDTLSFNNKTYVLMLSNGEWS